MTIEELINELREAIENGYKPDTRICVDTVRHVWKRSGQQWMETAIENSHWDMSLDTDSSGYPDKDQWKIAINVCEDEVNHESE
jgi:hypothetical protein